MKLGFMSANFVARESGYSGREADAQEQWREHERLTRQHVDLAFMDRWMPRVSALGFEGVSMWTAHAWYWGPTTDQLDRIADMAAANDLEIYGYAGSFGRGPLEDDWHDDGDVASWRRTFDVAERLGVEFLEGPFWSMDERAIADDLAAASDPGFAYENHPETSIADIRDVIAGYDNIRLTVDTGKCATEGLSATETLRALGDELVNVHLKDVREEGHHRTCALGDGIVDVPGCLDVLAEMDYDGWVTIEHEPMDRDPMPAVTHSMRRVRRWLDMEP